MESTKVAADGSSTADPRRPRDYSVVIFCPLVIEQQATFLMLDEVHEDELRRSAGQTIIYTLGRIASHNVAIAGYPAGEAGIGISGSMVSEALRDFPRIEFGLLVGIGAGIPSPERDIRLGDVAVAVPNKDSPGIIGYDLIKVEEDQVRIKQWQNATHPLLRSAIGRIQVHGSRPGQDFRRHLKVTDKAPGFKRPLDRSMSSSSDDTLVSNNGELSQPQVHYGTILSGNGVIKSKIKRNELRDRFGGIAIEMEAAGMMSRLPVAVIRGISDFGDAQKNDDWHAYAALAAAAYAKEVILRLGSLKDDDHCPEPESVISSDIDASLSAVLPEPARFIGRAAELSYLKGFLDSNSPSIHSKRILAVWGFGGVGKSQLIAEFVRSIKMEKNSHDIFWVTGETKESFEQSICSYLKAKGSVGTTPREHYSEQRAVLVDSFFAELRTARRHKWLLIVDGIPSDRNVQDHVRRHIGKLSNGLIVLVTRSKSLIQHGPYWQTLEIKGLLEEEAVYLLQQETDDIFDSGPGDLLELARAVKCHPLSLSLAASAMSQSLMPAAQYVEQWKRRELSYEYLSADEALVRSFEISFAELENSSPLAAKLLMLFGYLDHSDMWLDLCLNAVDDDDGDEFLPDWLRQVAAMRNPRQLYLQIKNLSFVEAKGTGPRQEIIWEIHPAIHEFARQKAKSKGLERQLAACAVSLVAAKVPRSKDRDFIYTARRLALHAEQCKIYLDQARVGHLDVYEIKAFGDLFRLLGQYPEAKDFYIYALELLEREMMDNADDEDLETKANIENNLGLVFYHQKKYELALEAFTTSQSIYGQMSTGDGITKWSSLYNIGRALMMEDKLDVALMNLEQAAAFFKPFDANPLRLPSRGLETQRANVNEEAHIYYRVINDIGEIQLRKDHLDKAEAAFKEAFEGQTSQLGDDHPATFPIRLNIGRICVKKQRFGSAKNIFAYIIATYTGWWGRRHSETMRAVEEMADSHAAHAEQKRKMGDYEGDELKNAIDLLNEVVNFHTEVFGADSASARTTGSKLRLAQDFEHHGAEDSYARYYKPIEERSRS